MNLRTSISHYQGGSVRVNSTVYQIDKNGIIHDIDGADAKKLLAGDAWSVIDGTKVPKKAAPEPEKETSEGEEGELDLTTLGIKELRELADKYEIAYTARTGKARLIREISEVMEEE